MLPITDAAQAAVHGLCARTLAADPLLAPVPGEGGRDALRAHGDALACRQRFALSSVAQSFCPPLQPAQRIFTQLVTARSLAIGASRWPGVGRNLLLAPGAAGLSPHTPVAWAYSVFSDRPVAECPPVLSSPLHALKAQISDELAFAQAAAACSREWPLTLGVADGRRAEPVGNDAQAEMASPSAEQAQSHEDNGEEDADAELVEAAAETAPGAVPSPLPSSLAIDYQIYSTRYDRIVHPQHLATVSELEQLKIKLDAQLAPHRPLVARLAHRLQRLLLARQRRDWSKDLAEGWLDASRLSRLVVDPNQQSIFQLEEESRFKQTAVTLLLDNSGSMRGKSIAMTALCADILTHSLERCGIKVEVLGFTTAGWQDNPVTGDWQRAGSPANPGRLNALRHIIYKDMAMPWRRARRGFGVLLKEDLLKENIDGEALWWAASRLLARPEPRRLLIVISDGAPMDKSTLSANPKNYLERHLHQVVSWLKKETDLELHALGIGHPVARYYPNSVGLRSVEQLAEILATRLGEWLVV